MPAFSKSVIRLQLGIVSNPPLTPIDANTDIAPQIWRSSDVDFQIGIFDQFGACVDLSNIDFLEVDIFPMPVLNVLAGSNLKYNPYSVPPYPSIYPAPLLFVTVPAEDITSKVSLREWKGNVGQQATASFTWNQTQQLNLGGAVYRDFWLTVNSLNGGNKITYGGTRLRVYESGSQGIYLPNQSAPLTVPADTIFYIPPNTQIPFSQTIDVAGTIVAEGTLVQH